MTFSLKVFIIFFFLTRKKTPGLKKKLFVMTPPHKYQAVQASVGMCRFLGNRLIVYRVHAVIVVHKVFFNLFLGFVFMRSCQQ